MKGVAMILTDKLLFILIFQMMWVLIFLARIVRAVEIKKPTVGMSEEDFKSDKYA